MTIEAVTICLNYSDFLKETIPLNRPHLDRWIIVTSSDDHKTRQLCRDHSLECIISDEVKRDGEFSKGRLINTGLRMCEGKNWVLHLDADIALPQDFNIVLDEVHLDETCIYGCDRLNVTGKEQWDKIKGSLRCRNSCWSVDLYREGQTLGTRVANVGVGYTPIGFFQLWHNLGATWRNFPFRTYPVSHGTAARTDVQHALQWDRRKRHLIPELLVWHLETVPSFLSSNMGKNWSGRKTPEFGKESQLKDYC